MSSEEATEGQLLVKAGARLPEAHALRKPVWFPVPRAQGVPTLLQTSACILPTPYYLKGYVSHSPAMAEASRRVALNLWS